MGINGWFLFTYYPLGSTNIAGWKMDPEFFLHRPGMWLEVQVASHGFGQQTKFFRKAQDQ